MVDSDKVVNGHGMKRKFATGRRQGDGRQNGYSNSAQQDLRPIYAQHGTTPSRVAAVRFGPIQ